MTVARVLEPRRIIKESLKCWLPLTPPTSWHPPSSTLSGFLFFHSFILPSLLFDFCTRPQIEEVVCTQTEAGWDAARRTGEAETRAAALNVPLEQQFLWWEIMWRASGKGSGEGMRGCGGGGGVLRRGKKVFVCLWFGGDGSLCRSHNADINYNPAAYLCCASASNLESFIFHSLCRASDRRK